MKAWFAVLGPRRHWSGCRSAFRVRVFPDALEVVVVVVEVVVEVAVVVAVAVKGF